MNDQDNHNGVIYHQKPNILECEVKWALGSITMNKVSEGKGIPSELFQILKGDAVKVNMPANMEISAVATGMEKVSFHSNLKERQCKGCSDYCTIEIISHTNKVILKILQARL